MVRCDKCGKGFEVGNRSDGLPNGVGFELEGGRIINICAECLIKLGEMSDEEKDKFFEGLVNGNE